MHHRSAAVLGAGIVTPSNNWSAPEQTMFAHDGTRVLAHRGWSPVSASVGAGFSLMLRRYSGGNAMRLNSDLICLHHLLTKLNDCPQFN